MRFVLSVVLGLMLLVGVASAETDFWGEDIIRVDRMVNTVEAVDANVMHGSSHAMQADTCHSCSTSHSTCGHGQKTCQGNSYSSMNHFDRWSEQDAWNWFWEN